MVVPASVGCRESGDVGGGHGRQMGGARYLRGRELRTRRGWVYRRADPQYSDYREVAEGPIGFVEWLSVANTHCSI